MRLGVLREDEEIDVLFVIDSLIKKVILDGGYQNLRMLKLRSKAQPGYRVVYDDQNVNNYDIGSIFVQSFDDFTVCILSPWGSLPIKDEDEVVYQKVVDLHDVGSVTYIRDWLETQIQAILTTLKDRMLI